MDKESNQNYYFKSEKDEAQDRENIFSDRNMLDNKLKKEMKHYIDANGFLIKSLATIGKELGTSQQKVVALYDEIKESKSITT